MTPPHVLFGLDPLWVSSALLVATYGAIMTEKLNRVIVVGIGAGLMILSGVLSQDEAIRGVDFNTIALLAGMMLIVGITRRSGVFQYVAIWSTKLVGASPAGVLALLAVVTAVFSALLDNVTTVLLMVPVTLVVTQELEVPPYPFLFAEVFASNLGGTATLIGDPPNIMIGSAAGLTFNDFVVNLTPVIVVTMLVQLAALQLIWGRRLHTSVENRARVMAMDPRVAITDWRLLGQSLAVLFTVLVAFVFQRALHLQPGTIAVFGATVLLLLDSWWRTSEEQTHHVHSSLSDLEWITLFFFVGLFVVVAGVERAGLLRILAQKALVLTGGDFNVLAVVILWVSAVLSAVIDNIPFVVTMIPLVKELGPSFGGAAHLLPLWWALSLGACLGGNGTLIGASANLTVAGIAERKGVRFSFWTYTRTAFPLMLLTVAIAHLYLYLRYLR